MSSMLLLENQFSHFDEILNFSINKWIGKKRIEKEWKKKQERERNKIEMKDKNDTILVKCLMYLQNKVINFSSQSQHKKSIWFDFCPCFFHRALKLYGFKKNRKNDACKMKRRMNNKKKEEVNFLSARCVYSSKQFFLVR